MAHGSIRDGSLNLRTASSEKDMGRQPGIVLEQSSTAGTIRFAVRKQLKPERDDYHRRHREQ